MSYLTAWWDHRKTIKAFKSFRRKSARVTGMNKKIVMAHYNKLLQFRYRTLMIIRAVIQNCFKFLDLFQLKQRLHAAAYEILKRLQMT